MKEPLVILCNDPKGRIFLAQLSRAIALSPKALSSRQRLKLHTFISACLNQAESGSIVMHDSGGIDQDKTFFKQLVLPRQKSYFHLDRRKIDSKARMVSLVPLKVLTDDLMPNGSNALHGSGQDGTLARAVSNLSGKDFKTNARVGANERKGTNLCWATRYDDVVNVAPSLKRRHGVVPFEEAQRLRNFLGLGHYGAKTQFAVLIFREDALERHCTDKEENVTRPFIFEGIGNHRFLLLDQDKKTEWNWALDLEKLETPSLAAPKGGREIVMTSIPCAEIERCKLSEPLDYSPCEKAGADEQILDIMLAGESLKDAVARIEGFVSEGPGR